tara:strand:+ start:438 stop:1079 length:642 start_codon:yes stop_codon:yes gene_type:complete
MSLIDLINKKSILPSQSEALPGRKEKIEVPNKHFITGTTMVEPFPSEMKKAMFGMGCFWGVEKIFWQLNGVFSTMVGYSDGLTPNPTYNEVCTGRTGHNEVALIVYNPNDVSFEELLIHFWEGHNPTQGMRQGNDSGTQYRSGIYCFDKEQNYLARQSKDSYQVALTKSGMGKITTEINDASEFYYAEHYHQQYLAKNPDGYCGIGGTGITFK